MVFIRLSEGTSGTGMSSVVGAMQSFFDPAAARAQEELQHQHEAIVPTPSPGDQLLREGRIVIERSSNDSPSP